MLRAGDKAVNKLVTSFAQLLNLCTVCTGGAKYLTSQVFFVRSLCTRISLLSTAYTHGKSSILNLLELVFYPLSTRPINTNKLNKGIVI